MIMGFIYNVWGSKLTTKSGKENLLTEITELYSPWVEFEKLTEECDKVLSVLNPQDELIKHRNQRMQKRLTRKFLYDLFYEGHKVCITTLRNYYLAAHLTQADLSLLSDFYLITE